MESSVDDEFFLFVKVRPPSSQVAPVTRTPEISDFSSELEVASRVILLLMLLLTRSTLNPTFGRKTVAGTIVTTRDRGFEVHLHPPVSLVL